MTITISSNDPRSIKAVGIAATSGQWLKRRTTAGKKYGIPAQSRPGHFYSVDMRTCDCPDFDRRGGPCKHVLAVHIHVARVRAQQA